MRVVTWNMGFFQHQRYHEDAWSYLLDVMAPDVALLQETAVPESVAADRLIFKRINVKQSTRPWGTAIMVPHMTLRELPIATEHYPRLACGLIQVGQGVVGVASIHAYSDLVFPRLDAIINDIEASLMGGPFVIGGDLNSARLAEEVWPGYGHGPFWRLIDEGRFVDCCQRVNGREIQTFIRKGTVHPLQDDHIFVSRDLAVHVDDCRVVDSPDARHLSDHLPLVVELEIT